MEGEVKGKRERNKEVTDHNRRREGKSRNLKKIPAHLYATTRMKYEAINKYSSTFSVRKMCKVLELEPSNYYRWKRTEEKRKCKIKEELKVIRRVEKVFMESHKTYGYRMIQKALQKEGMKISEYKVRRIMKENGLYQETGRKHKPIRNEKVDGKYHKNLLQQNFKTDKKNQVWVGDITYIKTQIGWVYLAVVMDLYNREVIGYAISKKIDTELIKQALSNAIARQGKQEGMIFHSDRGCQYASKGYQKMLIENGIIGSMSRAGCPYDNSCMESFFATLKKELIYRREYDTIDAVRKELFCYIEIFYNRKRLHSVLGYMSPVSYRLEYDRISIV